MSTFVKKCFLYYYMKICNHNCFVCVNVVRFFTVNNLFKHVTTRLQIGFRTKYRTWLNTNNLKLFSQDLFRLQTPGGGGYGRAEDKSETEVKRRKLSHVNRGSLYDYTSKQHSHWFQLTIGFQPAFKGTWSHFYIYSLFTIFSVF